MDSSMESLPTDSAEATPLGDLRAERWSTSDWREWMTSTPAHRVAPVMLGWVLDSVVGGRTTALRITEVEAYDQSEPAAHTFRGPTPRTSSMFDRAGTLYVYRSYGLHWCANVVTGEVGHGSAVLLRAGVPVAGADVMAERRGVARPQTGAHPRPRPLAGGRPRPLAGGPGMLTQALGVDGGHDGVDLFAGGELRLRPGAGRMAHRVTPRVGISKAVELPWRFVAVDGQGTGVSSGDHDSSAPPPDP